MLATKITCWLSNGARLENSSQGRWGIHMPNNSKLITNVDTVQAFALHKKTACIKPLINDKTSACKLVTCIIKERKGVGGRPKPK